MSARKGRSVFERTKIIIFALLIAFVHGGVALYFCRGGLDPAYRTRAVSVITNIRLALDEDLKRGKTSPSGITEIATPAHYLLTEFSAEGLKDPWRHDYLIQRLPATTGELTYRIYSLGEDGVVSADDVDDSHNFPPD